MLKTNVQLKGALGLRLLPIGISKTALPKKKTAPKGAVSRVRFHCGLLQRLISWSDLVIDANTNRVEGIVFEFGASRGK
jgi:hypothetical protein